MSIFKGIIAVNYIFMDIFNHFLEPLKPSPNYNYNTKLITHLLHFINI